MLLASPDPTPALPFCHVTLRGQKPLPRAYPRALCTIGDHLRRRRLDLCLLQRQAAERLGVHEATVTNWELKRTKPALRFLPGIVRFLGYTPWTGDGSIGERLLAFRRERGLSQTAFAGLLGVDPGTLSRWERGLRVPTGRYARLVVAFLGRGDRGITPARNGG
jgi:transcriptional regulator with XRE-family HTH domain